jgi:hypothetical protein
MNRQVWAQPLFSSRLIEYETWNRINRGNLGESNGEATRALLTRISFVELKPVVLARALDPFPLPVRTLDALYLASLCFLRKRRPNVALATFDNQMRAVAEAIGIPLV